MQTLASVTDYFLHSVPSISIQAPFGESMLVIASRQVDETIGCGGALALQVRSGKAAFVTIVQDADRQDEFGRTRERSELRDEVSHRAAAALHLGTPHFLTNLNFATQIPQGTEELLSILTEREVDVVFTPSVLDGDLDNRTLNFILASALKRVSWNVRVLCYEARGLTMPNVLVIIDEVLDDKLKSLSCFAFGTGGLDCVNWTKGLNMYRSRLLSPGQCQYAEGFFELPCQKFIELVERMHWVERIVRRP